MRRISRRKTRTQPGSFPQQPFQQLDNPFAPFEIFSADHIEAIHNASLQLLQETGMDFQLDEAVEILGRNGAHVTPGSQRVRMDADFVMEKIATAPSHYSLHARNPKHTLRFGGSSMAYSSIASAPNVSDAIHGRRSGNFEDYKNLLRLTQSLNVAHFVGGYAVEPIDLPVQTRHLHALEAAVRLTDKAFFGYAIGRTRMEDAIEIARIVRGVDRETLSIEPSVHTVVNSNSPLVYDGALLDGAIAMARAGQIVIYTPFTLAGAMAPVTLAGALVQQNAEALAGIAFSQCVNPGAPVMYGSFTSNVDMRSGSPAFGTPEFAKATIASGQLARRYNLPIRASNVTSSNAPDAQAAYESQMSLWACMLGHINAVNHGLGWQEGGLCTSYEKFILDAEMIQMMQAFLSVPEMDEDALAVEAIQAVGPASHFFQSPHTMARYESAFNAPLLSNWQNFENWQDAGSQDATTRATGIWQQMLNEYEEPALAPEISEELSAFVAKSSEAGGAPAL